MSGRLHFCWLIDEWKESREVFLRSWVAAGWPCILWHGGQLENSPVEGVELRHADEIVAGSPIDRAFRYEQHHKAHAPCADLFRYEVLCQLGGAYADIDTTPGKEGRRPSLLKTERPLFGREWLMRRWDIEIRFIVSPPGHPLLEKIRDTAALRTEKFIESGGYAKHGTGKLGELAWTLNRTGPFMAAEVLRSYDGNNQHRYRLANVNKREYTGDGWTDSHAETNRIAGYTGHLKSHLMEKTNGLD